MCFMPRQPMNRPSSLLLEDLMCIFMTCQCEISCETLPPTHEE